MQTAKLAIIVDAITKNAEKKLTGLGNTLGKVGKIGAALGGAAVVGIGALATGIAKLAMDAAKLEPTRVTFDNLTKSIGSTADSMLDKLRPATMGVVSDADLMQAANKLMAMGLAETEDQAASLSKMAVTLGTAMGEDATASMENFALMLANQSIPRLDSFGISSGRVRERILELMEADESLTREQAFLTATMEAGEAAMEKVGDVSGTTGVAMQQVRASFKNVTDQVGAAFLPILAKLLKPLGELAMKYGPKVVEFAETFAARLQKDLWPILKPVGDFIARNLGPAMNVLGQILAKIVIPAFKILVGILKAVWKIIQPVLSAIQKVGSGILGKALGAIGIKVPGRQRGGPVAAGRAYMVGESGPELFIPGRSGRVAAGAGGGGRGGRIVVEIPLIVSGREIARAISPNLADELRRAGVMAL